MLFNPNASTLLPLQGIVYASPFPGTVALASEKFKALLKRQVELGDGEETTVGAQFLTLVSGQAWNLATQVLWKNKAVYAGDVLADLAPAVASFTQDGSLQGLVAEVPFLLSADPDVQLDALKRVGMDLALRAVSAIPVAGWIVGLVVSAAQVFVSVFRGSKDSVPAPQALRLPWDGYSKDTDEAITKQIVEYMVRDVDWTSAFGPPTEIRPWRAAEGIGEDGQRLGTIFAPSKKDNLGRDDVAYADRYGVIPGTFRVAGVIQASRPPQPDHQLLRFYQSGELIRVGDRVENTGDWFVGLGQVGGMLWQQAMVFGGPDAYKVDAAGLQTLWADWFEQLYESAFDAGLGDLLLPYLARKVGAEWLIGVDAAGVLRPGIKGGQGPGDDEVYDGWDLVPLVTRGIWSAGMATKASRTPCLLVESEAGEQETYPERFGLGPDGPVAPPPPGGWRGRRCVPWPPGELLLSDYARVDDAVVLPALRRLERLQRDALAGSLVCAYVRPDPVDGRPAYAAFRNNKPLADRCRELRQVLLTHPARFTVDWQTARDVDPAYAQLLKEAGAPTTPAQRAYLRLQLAGETVPPLDPEAPPDPRPEPPQGGLPFGREFVRPGQETASAGWLGPVLAGGAAVGTAIAAAVGVARARKGRRR